MVDIQSAQAGCRGKKIFCCYGRMRLVYMDSGPDAQQRETAAFAVFRSMVRPGKCFCDRQAQCFAEILKRLGIPDQLLQLVVDAYTGVLAYENAGQQRDSGEDRPQTGLP